MVTSTSRYRRIVGAATSVLAAAFVVVFTLLVATIAPSWAQSKRYPPPLVDVDDPGPLHSDFWERTLHPDSGRYRTLVASARDLLGKEMAGANAEAAALLAEAIELRPDGIEAHWLAAVAHERTASWPDCTAAYKKVFTLDAGYHPRQPLTGRKPAWALDYGLALCRARTGDYEGAVTHFSRIASRGVTDNAAVYLHLGESYMALGRLAEAIDAMRAAVRRAPRNPRIAYALAVAYDRNEMVAESRTQLERARTLNVALSLLEDPTEVFLPAADRSYTLALAFAHRERPADALLMIRRYLAMVSDSPWRHRAGQHMVQLAQRTHPADLVVATGPIAVTAEDLRTAVSRIDTSLQDCVRETPQALFEIGIRLVKRSPKSAPTIGIKARVVDSIRSDDSRLATAQGCLEDVAKRLPLRLPARTRGHLALDIPIIAR